VRGEGGIYFTVSGHHVSILRTGQCTVVPKAVPSFFFAARPQRGSCVNVKMLPFCGKLIELCDSGGDCLHRRVTV